MLKAGTERNRNRTERGAHLELKSFSRVHIVSTSQIVTRIELKLVFFCIRIACSKFRFNAHRKMHFTITYAEKRPFNLLYYIFVSILNTSQPLKSINREPPDYSKYVTNYAMLHCSNFCLLCSNYALHFLGK